MGGTGWGEWCRKDAPPPPDEGTVARGRVPPSEDQLGTEVYPSHEMSVKVIDSPWSTWTDLLLGSRQDGQ